MTTIFRFLTGSLLMICDATLDQRLQRIRIAEVEPEYSLDFQLPNSRRVDQAFTCFRKSDYFCFLRLTFEERQTSNELEDGQREAFEDLIQTVYRFINWYALDRSPEACCKYQGKIFMENGERYGVRAIFYIQHLITHFQTNDKVLTYVKADYRGASCLNVISELGFGVSYQEVKFKGNPRRGVKFVLPIDLETEIYKFDRVSIRDSLTFNWFKHHVICKEKEWVCDMDPERVKTWLFAGVHTRWIYNYGAPAVGRFFGFGGRDNSSSSGSHN